MVEGGPGDAHDLSDGSLGDLLLQEHSDFLLLAIKLGGSQRPLARAAASPSLVSSEIRSLSTSANNPNRAIITLVGRVTGYPTKLHSSLVAPVARLVHRVSPCKR